LRGGEAPVIGGFTGDQRFFMGWAQVWRGKYKDEELRNRLLTDPHSPPGYRVTGPMSNMDEFYTAYGVREGDALHRPAVDRVRIW
jgi:endothelin-converting enzyme